MTTTAVGFGTADMRSDMFKIHQSMSKSSSTVIDIAKTTDSPKKHQAVFPANPDNFTPQGLILIPNKK